jgi:hypothetical protein
MHKTDLITLYDYNYWANARILDAAAQVPHEQYCAPANLSHGSLRATLVHTFVAELVWRSRCQAGISLPALPTQAEYPTLEILRAHWLDEEGKMRLYLASLTDESIYTPVQYVTTKWCSLLKPPLEPARPCCQPRHPVQSRGRVGVGKLRPFARGPGHGSVLPGAGGLSRVIVHCHLHA